MGDMMRANGVASTYEWRGKTYKVSGYGPGIELEFEDYLEKRAWDTYRRAARYLPPDDAAGIRADTARDITAGVYRVGGMATSKAMECREHLTFLWWCLLQEHNDVTLAMAREMISDKYAEIISQINASVADPTRPEATPATT